MFSAYDLKKIIPRAIFALILINLSWGLMDIFIKIVNALGMGAQDLVMAPFGGAGGINLNSASAITFSGLMVGVTAAVAIGIVPILGVAITGLFGMLFAFGIILLRKVFLVALVIVAPIAIGLSVFPQTESWAKKWWDWFSKLMLMYPFIMAFFGLSEVCANILSEISATGIERLIYQLAAIALLILPYFLVGKALSLAGGAIGKVAGMVNNKDRGLIDKTKKWEAGKVAERRYDFARGQRFDGRNPFSKGVNTVGRSLRHPIKTVLKGPGTRDSENIRLLEENANSQEERHPAAKNLNKQQVLALAIGENKDRVEAEAQKRAQANGTSVDTEKAKLKSEYDSAKAAMGGSVDTASQLWAVKKSIQDGSMDGAQAAAAVEDIAARSATGSQQQVRIAEQLAAKLDAETGDKQSVLKVNRVSANLTSNAGATTTTADFHSSVNAVFQGDKAVSRERLAQLDEADVADISRAVRQQTTGSLSDLSRTHDASGNPIDAAAAQATIVQQRSNLVRIQEAASQAGKTDLFNNIQSQLDLLDGAIEAHRQSVVSGATPNPHGVVIDLDVIRAQSRQQAAQNNPGFRPTP